jgi:hypothetical protein
MDSQIDFNAGLRAVQDGQLDSKSDTELVSMIKALARWQGSASPGSQIAGPAIQAIQKRLDWRQTSVSSHFLNYLTSLSVLADYAPAPTTAPRIGGSEEKAREFKK